MDERRAHPRKRLSTVVTFHDALGAPLRGSLCDIGRGGCFVASPSYLTFGERVLLELRLSVAVRATGRVVWTRHTNERDRPAGMGIVFTEVDEASLVAIDRVRGAEVSLPKPKTFIGVAPPSSPPTHEIEDIDVALQELMARTEEAPAPPPPSLPVTKPPVRRPRARWLIAGGAAILVLCGLVLALIGLRRHRPVNAAPDAVVDAVSEALSAVDASVSVTPPVVDAGATTPNDAGRGKKAKPKPRHK